MHITTLLLNKLYSYNIRTYVITDLFVGVDPPNNVKSIVLAPRIIEVSWDPIISEEVTGYFITYTTSVPHARGSNITVYGNNISKTTLKNLEEDTLYSITVQSVSENNISGPSNMVSATTWSTGKYMCGRV